jgi:hypothetical protein
MVRESHMFRNYKTFHNNVGLRKKSQWKLENILITRMASNLQNTAKTTLKGNCIILQKRIKA